MRSSSSSRRRGRGRMSWVDESRHVGFGCDGVRHACTMQFDECSSGRVPPVLGQEVGFEGSEHLAHGLAIVRELQAAATARSNELTGGDPGGTQLGTVGQLACTIQFAGDFATEPPDVFQR